MINIINCSFIPDYSSAEELEQIPCHVKDKGFKVILPAEKDTVNEALFMLHRQIDRQYRELPWPSKICNIVYLLQIKGGGGDIVAAARVIADLLCKYPFLMFDCVVVGAEADKYDPKLFFAGNDLSKVTIRKGYSKPLDDTPVDLVLAGPVKLEWGARRIKECIAREIAGPIFGFAEIAEDPLNFYYALPPRIVLDNQEKEDSQVYPLLHSCIFPNKSGNNTGILCMGLQPGSGIFLDENRINAPLSRGDCCPSYLSKIEDDGLRNDILEAMGVLDGQSQPDYDTYSFNSGYAHHLDSWKKFIRCVARHEKQEGNVGKNVVIVLNQRGAFTNLSFKEFQQKIFTKELITSIKLQGYTSICLKGTDQRVYLQNTDLSMLTRMTGWAASFFRIERQAPKERSLTVIIRQFFTPHDMKQMQLASKRLLGTGDNSALEAWCARCELFLYEDVNNGGCKWRFLQQQVDLAKEFSPNLSRLLALFGGDRRLVNSYSAVNQSLSAESLEEIERLLDDDTLSEATLKFCKHITANYSFKKTLEAALKRTVWHGLVPELETLEIEAMDETFKTGLINYFKEPEGSEKILHIRNLPQLGKQIEDRVLNYSQSI